MPYPENSSTDDIHTVSHLIATMRGGAGNDRATTELEKLIEAIHASTDQKSSGFVNIKIKVSKLKDGETELSVDMKVTSSIPVPPIPKGIYYPGDGKVVLSRTDPRQMSMLDKIERETGDINQVGRGRVVEGSAVRHG